MKFDKIVVASHNQGKIKEIKSLLSSFGIEVISAAELELPDVEETGATFEDNARLKAESLSAISGYPCLADDSGLCVHALGNRPGVYSARYAPNRDFVKGMQMLLSELENSGSFDRGAHFSCVLAFAVPGQKTKIFEGRVDGVIVSEPQGDGGFGYDPIFMPNGYNKTFAFFDSDEKNKVSHRGRALDEFKTFLSEN